MSITFYQSNRILDLNFGSTSYVVPATLYFGLSTTPINDDGTGATEPSTLNGYARVAVINNKTNFDVAASGSLTNLTQITFPESTASWGTITTAFIADASTAGNILYFDDLSPARTVQSFTTLFYAIGGVTIQMTNA